MKYTLVIAAFLACTVAAYNPESSSTYLEEDNKKDDEKKEENKKEDNKKDDEKKEENKKEEPKCAATFTFFTDKECKTAVKADDAAATTLKTTWETATKTVVKGADGACTAKAKTSCDATGVTVAKFTDDACATAAEGDPQKWVWGDCTKAVDGKLYFKMAASAKAMMVGAAATLAFVGS